MIKSKKKKEERKRMRNRTPEIEPRDVRDKTETDNQLRDMTNVTC